VESHQSVSSLSSAICSGAESGIVSDSTLHEMHALRGIAGREHGNAYRFERDVVPAAAVPVSASPPLTAARVRPAKSNVVLVAWHVAAMPSAVVCVYGATRFAVAIRAASKSAGYSGWIR
jgi:hypothetical protein